MGVAQGTAPSLQASTQVYNISVGGQDSGISHPSSSLLHRLNSKQVQLRDLRLLCYIQPWLTGWKLYCWQGRPTPLGPQMPSPQPIYGIEIPRWERQDEKTGGSIPIQHSTHKLGSHSEKVGPLSLLRSGGWETLPREGGSGSKGFTSEVYQMF